VGYRLVSLIPLSALAAVSCGTAFNPPAPNYSTDVVLETHGSITVFNGVGECYEGGTVFSFGLDTQPDGTLGFAAPLDEGPHAIDGGDTALDWPKLGAVKGTITVNHMNSRDRADGEIAATGESVSIRGHWGCRFDEY
jgi:hypothetical protein